jgi:hypothetical protein
MWWQPSHRFPIDSLRGRLILERIASEVMTGSTRDQTHQELDSQPGPLANTTTRQDVGPLSGPGLDNEAV